MGRDAGGVLAVIPARGGSKSIPRKNMLLVGGKPLIARTVAAACNAPGVSRVLVSSDDDEILQTAHDAGAEPHRRPAEIAGDEASSESALFEVLEALRETEGYVPELLIFLQCTSPLTGSVDVQGALETFRQNDADSLVSVCDFGGFVWREDENGQFSGVNHDKAKRLRRQERQPEYVENGAIYIMRVKGFLEARHRFFGKLVPYVMDQRTALELDEIGDLGVLDLLIANNTAESE